jgi:hypothetical protein
LFLPSSGPGFPIDIDYAAQPCGTGATDATLCAVTGPIDLPPGGPTPAAESPGQIGITIGIANAANFEPQPTPTYEAHAIALKFPGASGVVIPLPQGVTLIPSGQVHLQGFAPNH